MVQVNSFAGFVPCIGTGPYLPPVFRRRVYLCVLFMIFVIDYSQNLVNGLKCYTDVDGKQITTCKETEGFRTCFTKYNDSKFHPSPVPFGVKQNYKEGIVTGRGCSTKDKVFFKECETHSYGDTVEKMCFCSFFLCNGAAISICPNILLITVLATLMSVHHLFLNESSNININTTTGTNSWPFWGGDLRPKRQMVHVVSVAASDSHSQAIVSASKCDSMTAHCCSSSLSFSSRRKLFPVAGGTISPIVA
ncbi:uncharacterized protein LOC131883852 isoform X2 [Tigriopus californicus]|uniref:uncharacterized protein LOC131883852 isoform X2 n=1 Tax=Tigriopus californicus TaxID=6832 RepID=UPI0027DA9D68|nr:uncharacterized protein LOC131883852 isoform X2 [Tigriopus californicus]